MKRKPIQISVTGQGEYSILYVLYDDGTIWRLSYGEWHKCTDPPQD